MAYDEDLAERVRHALAERERVEERKMFGGLCFMLGGHMVAGVVGDELMARVGADGEDDALAQPHARPMDFTGRPMAGLVFVAAGGVVTDEAVRAWVERASAFVSTLPPK
jgi:TfoX/Sxy family transcriptional regulator of competence genes